MSSKMNNMLQVICSIFGISCCLPWFHLQIRPVFSSVFTAVHRKDSKVWKWTVISATNLETKWFTQH